MFLEDGPKQMKEIEAALNRQDLVTVRKWGHTLKGSLGYFGAAQAGSLAQRLERQATDGKLADCRATFRVLQAALECLTAEMCTAKV